MTAPAWQAELGRRWDEPHRRHHDRRHLDEVLAALDVLAAAGEPGGSPAVRAAAWAHDAVYDPARADNEERSAALAAQVLGADGWGRRDVEEVVRLVLLTRDHEVADDDPAGAVLSDADLWVLAAPADRYAAYARAVREEYAHVPEAAFRRARAAVLRTFLERPWVYATPTGRARWEDDARRNVGSEVERLTAG